MSVLLGEWKITLRELTEGLEVVEVRGNLDVTIDTIEYDSRLVRPNALFVAITGYAQDGYTYVLQALASGAVAVMGEKAECDAPVYVRVKNVRKALSDTAAKFYGYPGQRLKVCGVTGTNGKTTTTTIIRNILQARGKKVGLANSLIYDTGAEQFKAERTTPESLDLQRLLFLMRKNQCNNAVIEVSSHALVLHRVDNVAFRVVVYTNFTRDHLDFHGTMEEYFKAKALLLKKLEGPLSYAVINLDVPEFRELFGMFEGQYIAYSLDNPEADVHCRNYEIRPDGSTFDLVTPMGTHTVNLKLPGRFNLMNALAAAAGGLASGIDIDNVVRGLEMAEPIPGRFNYVGMGQPFGVYVDFAHTPDAISRLCETARGLLADGRLLLLFGCGGDRDRGKRPLMGKAATTSAEYVVVTSDNPRSEVPESIIDEIKPGLLGKNYEIVVDRRAAIHRILSLAKPNDIVLLAGKGAETYQEIKGIRHPFDDKDVAREELITLGFSGVGVAKES